jgi:F-type H+-transporting ATPase subunit b
VLSALIAAGGGGLLPDFMTPEGQVFAWTILVFMTLLGILWKFAWGPVMHALEQREQNIQKRIDDAEKKFKDAEARVAEYEKRMNNAKDEAAAIISEGKRDVEKLKEGILAEANAEAAKTLERAKREISLARDAAVADMRDQMVALTSRLTQQVIEREIKAEDHRRFIEEGIARIEKN